MKKILFILYVLLFSVVTRAQYITTIGDTVDLKNTTGSGIVLLERYAAGTDNGGGFFVRGDSAYVENGTNAFDYPYDGYQWIRLNLVDQYVRPSSTDNYLLKWDIDHYSAYSPASIDSFYTTGTTDTIAISGITSTTVFAFFGWTPTYSTAIDSVNYTYYCKTDTCFLTRTSYTGNGVYKSGGQYTYIRMK